MWSRKYLPFRITSVCSGFVLFILHLSVYCCFFFRSVFLFISLAIVLSVLLQYTDFDYTLVFSNSSYPQIILHTYIVNRTQTQSKIKQLTYSKTQRFKFESIYESLNVTFNVQKTLNVKCR